jgi:hypothetical protein
LHYVPIVLPQVCLHNRTCVLGGDIEITEAEWVHTKGQYSSINVSMVRTRWHCPADKKKHKSPPREKSRDISLNSVLLLHTFHFITCYRNIHIFSVYIFLLFSHNFIDNFVNFEDLRILKYTVTNVYPLCCYVTYSTSVISRSPLMNIFDVYD